MIQEKLQEFKNSVIGKRVFILCGGPSVNDTTLSLLNSTEHKIICINSACEYIDTPHAVMWCDDSWANINHKWLKKYEGWKFSVKTGDLYEKYQKIDAFGFGRSIVLGKTGDYGYDNRLGSVRGNNTGTNALNFLLTCEVSSIGIIGMDMNTEAGKAHFHKKYTFPIKKEIYSNLFLPSVMSMGDELNKIDANVKIYNCSKYSKVTCFEYKNLKELI